jgi:hypothetical protein
MNEDNIEFTPYNSTNVVTMPMGEVVGVLICKDIKFIGEKMVLLFHEQVNCDQDVYASVRDDMGSTLVEYSQEPDYA